MSYDGYENRSTFLTDVLLANTRKSYDHIRSQAEALDNSETLAIWLQENHASLFAEAQIKAPDYDGINLSEVNWQEVAEKFLEI
jgi:hypothetical protein